MVVMVPPHGRDRAWRRDVAGRHRDARRRRRVCRAPRRPCARSGGRPCAICTPAVVKALPRQAHLWRAPGPAAHQRASAARCTVTSRPSLPRSSTATPPPTTSTSTTSDVPDLHLATLYPNMPRPSTASTTKASSGWRRSSNESEPDGVPEIWAFKPPRQARLPPPRNGTRSSTSRARTRWIDHGHPGMTFWRLANKPRPYPRLAARPAPRCGSGYGGCGKRRHGSATDADAGAPLPGGNTANSTSVCQPATSGAPRPAGSAHARSGIWAG